MTNLLDQVKADMEHIVLEWLQTDYLKKDAIFVIGCSTSEVAGKHIGTSGSEAIAEVIFSALQPLRKEKGVHLAFQCCEHLNRAIVMEKKTQEQLKSDPVTVIPHPKAGGSMASYAFQQFNDAVVVEDVVADAGIDIGDTMIGMHLKRVAVPLRFEQKMIASARITGARTRPKLIGGERAKY